MARDRAKGKTWLEVAVQNGGFRQAIKGLSWAYIWAIAREGVGHDPTVEEVADWWNAPARSAFRDQAAFRACFPMLESPAPMFEDPTVRATLGDWARAADRTENRVRAFKDRIRRSESAILSLGMGRASV